MKLVETEPVWQAPGLGEGASVMGMKFSFTR